MGLFGRVAAMKLDVSPLRDAVGQLERSLAYLHSDLAREDPGLREQFRAASIQAFEFVYGLATSFARRQLDQMVTDPAELRQMQFMGLMRLAADSGLVTSATAWHGFRDLRNRTSHTYDGDEAEAVVQGLDGFLAEARFLLDQLERKNRA